MKQEEEEKKKKQEEDRLKNPYQLKKEESKEGPKTPVFKQVDHATLNQVYPVVVYEDLVKEVEAEKPNINLVIIGHVDSGKSTLMGHLLYKLGQVSEHRLRQLEKES